VTTHIPYLTIVYTRFVSPSNTQGSRIVATSTYFGKKGKTMLNYDHALNSHENHRAAARKFLAKNTSDTFDLIGQSDNPSGSGTAWVFERKEG
jgi:hypothetical protein